MRFIIVFIVAISSLLVSSEKLQCKQHSIDQSCIQDAIFCINKKVIARPPTFNHPDIPKIEIEIEWLPDTFNNLSQFNSIELVEKNCHYFPYDLKENFNFLEILILKSLELQRLSYSDLRKFTKLKELDVSDNQITELYSSVFDNNKELQIINFSGNPLKHVGYNLLIPAINLYDSKFFKSGCIDIAQRGDQYDVMASLRLYCKPTEHIWQIDMHALTSNFERLQAELDRRDGKPVGIRCHANKSNPNRNENCLITGNYHPMDQRPDNSIGIYTEDKKYIHGSE